MKQLKAHNWATTLGTFAVVALTGCGAGNAQGSDLTANAAPTTAGTTATLGSTAGVGSTGSPTASATGEPHGPGSTATATRPSPSSCGEDVTPAPTAPATPGTPAPTTPAGEPFTTADGLYTFMLPGSWTAVEEFAPTLPDSPLSTTAYAIQDENGATVARFVGGFYGDGAAGPPVRHTVLDAAPLPNVTTTDGGAAHYAFTGYEPGGGLPMQFTASIGAGQPPRDGTYSPSLGQVPIGGNGYTIFRAEFAPDRFADLDNASAWMHSAEYAKLRNTLTSLTFIGRD